MRPAPLHVAVLALLCATTATAQKPAAKKSAAPAPQPTQAGAPAARYAAFAGRWEGKSMLGPKDSVVTRYVLTVDARTGDGTMTFTQPARRAPVAVKAIAVGGDSLVTESAPFASLLRKGQTVRTRTTARRVGEKLAGTFVATYGDGSKTEGKMEATRAKP